ncbi:alpha/beta hydrolase [Archangium primigenium]|uniref:alpha/beta hydrolase n=1 Tax=[Archangium] primigenium TaxID=2792470 RepID=UPI00195E1899|nr:alpha/beta hydrolase [Archangium primigenium]MBM7117420.1 alpha/beta hydrolase [Archangium primigenium]
MNPLERLPRVGSRTRLGLALGLLSLMTSGTGCTPSVRLRLASTAVRLGRGPERDPAELRRKYENRKPPTPATLPRALRNRCDVREDTVLGQPVYTLTPKHGASGWHIIYTHGGAFVNPLQGAHWDILEQLIEETGATVTVPLYPLAPEHTAAEAFPFLEQVYRDVLGRTAPARVVLCGDSAGGNLALAQALAYREQGLPLPGHLVLFSPWLDLTLSNPEVAAVQPRDIMLRASELVEEGRWWAGAEDPRGARLSPLFADLKGLPPLQIYQGTHDIFLPDARLLRDRVAAAGGQVQLDETPGGFHVFMGATFTPEAHTVFRRIAERLGQAP